MPAPAVTSLDSGQNLEAAGNDAVKQRVDLAHHQHEKGPLG